MSWLQRNRYHFGVFVIYFFALGIAYFPLLNKNFSSDDFRVLWRVCHDQQFRTEGFFRVLSDVTLYLNYLVGGYRPFYFNLFNLLVHLACSLLVYLFCLQIGFYWSGRNLFFAFCSGFFFVLYPFHSEAVVWIVGRGASLATLFALVAICLSVSSLKERWKHSLASFSYLVGLLAYESILSLPLIILIIHWMKYRNGKVLVRFMIFFGLAVTIYFALRVGISGSVLWAYGAGIKGLSFSHHGGHFFRIIGRLIAPPNQNLNRFLLVFAIALLAWVTAILFFVRSIRRTKASIVPFLGITLLFLCSLLVAVSFPVSTKTTSTDRLLYFPSVFLCIGASMMVSELAATTVKRVGVVGFLGICGLWGIRDTNRNWAFASMSTTRILSVAREGSDAGIHVYILNVPDEHEGAYMLAGVFNEALLINGVDTARVHQVNMLLKEQKGEDGRINPAYDKGGVYIFPGVRVIKADGSHTMISYAGREWAATGRDQIWYWDRESFRQLQ